MSFQPCGVCAMEWNVTAGGGNFEKAPAGNHPAVLVGLIDLGMQWMDAYKDRPGKYMRKAFFVWELVTKKQAGMKDKNLLIAADLTVSLHENATMTAWLKAPPRGDKAAAKAADMLTAVESMSPAELAQLSQQVYGSRANSEQSVEEETGECESQEVR